MTTVLTQTEHKVIIEDVSWPTYERLLADLDVRSAPRQQVLRPRKLARRQTPPEHLPFS